MIRHFVLMLVVGGLLLISQPAAADGPIQAQTFDSTNLRAGPGVDYGIVAALPRQTVTTLEARNAGQTWLLVHTDSGQRGWVNTRLLILPATAVLSRLGVSTEILTSAADSKVQAKVVTGPAAYAAQFTGGVLSAMAQVAARGKANGLKSQVFSRAGDCHAGGAWFLRFFGEGKAYILSPYAYLQSALDYFKGSFLLTSQAQEGGFTSAHVLDSTWSNKQVCGANESPLDCELRLDRPAVMILQFGVNDVESTLTAAQYSDNITLIVDKILGTGAIPILSTALERPIHLARAQAFNAIIRQIAASRNLPLIDLAAAISSLPNRGIDVDGIHLSPAGRFYSANFTRLGDGLTMWNFLALQSLYNTLPLFR